MKMYQEAQGEADLEEDASQKQAKKEEAEKFMDKLIDMAVKEVLDWCEEMDKGTDLIWQNMLGERWEEGKALAAVEREKCQREHREKQAMIEENARKRKAGEHVSLKDPEVFLDDLDPRY